MRNNSEIQKLSKLYNIFTILKWECRFESFS